MALHAADSGKGAFNANARTQFILKTATVISTSCTVFSWLLLLPSPSTALWHRLP